MAQICWDDPTAPGLQRLKFERCNTNNEESLKTVAAGEDSRSGVFQCCDSNLNFSTATCSEDDCEYGTYKKNKLPRQDPLSHRIIEKRRRDRMNNCLADLSRLIPTEYLKKGRGRIEKTEIIEMAIKHIKGLQSQDRATPIEHYRLGYQECMSETMRFMVEIEGHFPREPLFIRLLNHLQKHCDQVSKGSENYSLNSSSSSPPPSISINNNNNNNNLSSFSLQTPLLMMKNGRGGAGMDIDNDKIHQHQKSLRKPPSNDSEHHNNDNGNYTNGILTQHNQDIGFVHNNNNKNINEFEKDLNGGMTYKYKTDIKLRFSQDLNAHEVPKKPKIDDECGNSIASFENQSSNQSPPPSSSEPCCTRNSDSEFTHNQTSSDIPSSPSNHHHHNSMAYVPKSNLGHQRLPPASSSSPDNIKNRNLTTENFNIPIFVLCTKGSYYIPLTIDYKTLLPFLGSYNIGLDGGDAAGGGLSLTNNNVLLHPVTINVNFLPNFNADLKIGKYECNNNNWHH